MFFLCDDSFSLFFLPPPKIDESKPGSFSFLPSPYAFLLLSFLRSSSNLTASRSRTTLSRPRPPPPCIEVCNTSNLVSSWPFSCGLLNLFFTFLVSSLSFSSFSFSFFSFSLSLSPPTNQPQLVFLGSFASFLSLDFLSDFFSSGRFGIIDSESTRLVLPGSGEGWERESSYDCAGLMGDACAAWAWRFGRFDAGCRG